jgi:Tol biopolymer transport system component
VNPNNPNTEGTAIDWRPDGRALAAYAPENLFAPHPLIIYDCATGRQIASLLPPAVSEPSRATSLIGQSIMLRWSPDGSRLLLYALALGQVVVWGPAQLPH